MKLSELLFFSVFLIVIVFLLLIDLGIFNKKKGYGHSITTKEALLWTSIWVSFSLCLYVFLLFKGDILHGIQTNEQLLEIVSKYDHPIKLISSDFTTNIKIYNNNLSLEYLTGYIIEYALSVDNVFVMIMIFLSFGVEKKYYHRVLFWGIIGAIVLRFIFIFISSVLIQSFGFVLLFFGGLLIFAGIKMFVSRNDDEKMDTENHPIVKFASRYFKVHPLFEGHRFFIRNAGKLLITPLFLVLLVIEFSDLIFAVDSVPAVFSATKDPYIVFFSNIFAILGLRSLFFLLANIMDKFHYLKVGLSILLVFIGLKMILNHFNLFKLTTPQSLLVILLILGSSIIASLIYPKKSNV